MEKITIDKIIENVGIELSDKCYLTTHNYRLNIMLRKLEMVVKPGYKVANVGLSIFDIAAQELVEKFGSSYFCIVPDKLYLEKFNSRIYGDINTIEYDLTKDHDLNDIFNKFDVLIFIETLEHILYSDNKIIMSLSSLLKRGGIMMFSVPNAVEIGKRIFTLLGKNPYWSKDSIINGVYGGYGHIREYTVSEVVALLKPYFYIKKIEKLNPYGSSIRKIVRNILPRTWATHIYCEAIKR